MADFGDDIMKGSWSGIFLFGLGRALAIRRMVPHVAALIAR